MNEHEWKQHESGVGFVCAKCFRTSLQGRSLSKCKGRATAPPKNRGEVKVVEKIELTEEEQATAVETHAKRFGVPCIHRGEQAVIASQSMVRKCGCSSSQEYARIYACNVMDGLCQTIGALSGLDVDGKRVQLQRDCASYVRSYKPRETRVTPDELESGNFRKV